VSLYQDRRTKRTWVDWLVLIAVVGIAVLVILTSFHNTSKLAHVLEMPPGLMATVVEVAYGTFLFLRARQRALNLHTPIFLHVLYYITFGMVTAVNMWGLYIVHHAWGIVIGGTISFLMWGFETTLVWLWTRSREPYRKGFVKRIFDLIGNRIKAMIEALEEREVQNLAWIKYDAKRSSLKLIKKVRRAEEKRKKVIGDEELPEFFQYLEKQGDMEEIIVELNETAPKTIDVSSDKNEENAIVPMKRPIGFHAELSNIQTEPQKENTVIPPIEQRSNSESNTKKWKKEDLAREETINCIKKRKKYSATSIAKTVGCSRSTAHKGIKQAEALMRLRKLS
jgi:hypothetical protein